MSEMQVRLDKVDTAPNLTQCVMGQVERTCAKNRVAWVVTVPSAVTNFAMPHLLALSDDYDITLFVNGCRDDIPGLPTNVTVVTIDIQRKISPFSDIKVLISLWMHFRRIRPVLVHSLLPKSGLLGMTAARYACVPYRLHSFTGQVWATSRGLHRRVLRAVDRWSASCATATITDSQSQRRFLIDEKVLSDATVFGSGSICGVDSERFDKSSSRRQNVRGSWGMGDDSFVVGFLGRINRDKGVLDLASAFALAEFPQYARLVIVGPDEDNLEADIRAILGEKAGQCVFTGRVNRPEEILPGFDLFCLPSYREGFGNSVLEASACGIPVVTSRIYGLTDAVEEGVTGWMHAAGDVTELAKLLEEASRAPTLLAAMGLAGRTRALRDFSTLRIVEEQRLFYRRILMPQRER